MTYLSFRKSQHSIPSTGIVVFKRMQHLTELLEKLRVFGGVNPRATGEKERVRGPYCTRPSVFTAISVGHGAAATATAFHGATHRVG